MVGGGRRKGGGREEEGRRKGGLNVCMHGTALLGSHHRPGDL